MKKTLVMALYFAIFTCVGITSSVAQGRDAPRRPAQASPSQAVNHEQLKNAPFLSARKIGNRKPESYIHGTDCMGERTLYLVFDNKAQYNIAFMRRGTWVSALNAECIGKWIADATVEIYTKEPRRLDAFVYSNGFLIPLAALKGETKLQFSKYSTHYARNFVPIMNLLAYDQVDAFKYVVTHKLPVRGIYALFFDHYSTQCRSHIKSFTTIDSTTTKTTSGFGGSSTEVIDQHDYQIEARAADYYTKYAGVATGLSAGAISKRLKRIINDFGCGSEEVQGIRKSLYEYADRYN